MASLQQQSNGTFHIAFHFGGTKYKRSLKTSNQKQALALKARLEDTVQLVEHGRIELPDTADVPTFMLSDGKKAGKTICKEVRLATLFDRYFEAMPKGNLEEGTLYMMKMHRTRLESTLGKQFSLKLLSYNDLQNYVNKRAEHKGIRGKNLNATTIKKELVTLRGLWKWAITAEQIPVRDFPSDGLRYPKVEEMPPFQTFAEVSKQTADLAQKSSEAKELWATVFLDKEEIEELLDHVQKHANHAFIYPMFMLAAHTGARRSELMRSQVGDVQDDVLTIRERKRRKRQNSTRQVPISSRLRKALNDWLDVKPDVPHTFCHVPSTRCKSLPGDPLSASEMNSHFRIALSKSRFEHLRGWHVFRHSFCSNCAANQVDQRVIDSWVGHTTDEMRRRYRHLFPNMEKTALLNLFG